MTAPALPPRGGPASGRGMVVGLPAGSGVVHIAQVHHVHIAVARRVDLISHLRRDAERDAFAGAPVPDEDDPSVGRDGSGSRSISGKREQNSPHGVCGEFGEELGDPVVVEPAREARSLGELHTCHGPLIVYTCRNPLVVTCLEVRQHHVARQYDLRSFAVDAPVH